MSIPLGQPAPGCIPAEWFLVVELAFILLMLSFAAIRKRLRVLLWSNDALGWYGGILLTTSIFMIHNYGPWGVEMSPFTRITWNWRFPDGLTLLLEMTPYFLGFLTLIAAFLAAVLDAKTVRRVQWIWILVGMSIWILTFMAAVVDMHVLSATSAPTARLSGSRLLLVLSLPTVVLLSVSAPVLACRSDQRRYACTILLPSLLCLLLFGWAIVMAARQGENPFWLYREGHWTALAGALLLIAAGIRLARHRLPTQENRCEACGYDLTGNVSGVCSECGKQALPSRATPVV